VAILAAGQDTVFDVASPATLMVGAHESRLVIVINRPVASLYPYGFGRERPGRMANPAGDNAGGTAVFMASYAIGIFDGCPGGMVMALGTVIGEPDMLGVVKVYLLIKPRQRIQDYKIRIFFGVTVVRSYGQQQD